MWILQDQALFSIFKLWNIIGLGLDLGLDLGLGLGLGSGLGSGLDLGDGGWEMHIQNLNRKFSFYLK